MSDLLAVTLPVFAIGAAAFAWANRRAPAAVRRDRWIKFATYFAIVHVVLAAAMMGTVVLAVLLAVVSAIGCVELARASGRLSPRARVASWSIFASAVAGMIALTGRVTASRIACLYVIVAAFDGFSQAGGQLFGRKKLAPAVSPGKTVEGSLIGTAAAIGCAALVRTLAQLTLAECVAVGLLASVAGLFGDLSASWIKRRAGLKDFGHLLPGHGGILDRFDSFIAAAAAFFVLSFLRP